MVELVPGKAHRSKVPQVAVDNPLKPGRYRFSLTVIDDSGNESQPAELTVSVVEQTRPDIGPIVAERQPIVADPRIRILRPLRPS
jgi:hypothetical protein